VAQEQAPEHSVVGQCQANRLDETSGQVVDLEVHHLDLLDDVGVIGLQLPVPAKVGNALLAPTPGPEPARGFPQEEDAANEDHSGWNELDSERNEPLVAAVRHALGHAKVDPETDEAANLPAEFVSADQTASNSRRRDL
jgi:hypothetical protein